MRTIGYEIVRSREGWWEVIKIDYDDPTKIEFEVCGHFAHSSFQEADECIKRTLLKTIPEQMENQGIRRVKAKRIVIQDTGELFDHGWVCSNNHLNEASGSGLIDCAFCGERCYVEI